MLNACRSCGRPTTGTWCATHREAGEAAERARRAAYRRPGRSSKRDAQSIVRRQVLADAGGICEWCGAPASEVDHLVPVKLGGTDARANLLAACRTCNRSRGASGEPPRRTGSGRPPRPRNGGVGSGPGSAVLPGSSPPAAKEVRIDRPRFSPGGGRGHRGGRSG